MERSGRLSHGFHSVVERYAARGVVLIFYDDKCIEGNNHSLGMALREFLAISVGERTEL